MRAFWRWLVEGNRYEMSSVEFWVKRESRRIGDPYGFGDGR